MIEKLFAGNPNEMIGIYHLDMGHRNMDHYGRLGRDQGGGNRPGASDIEYSEIRRANNQSRLNELRQATFQPEERQDTSEDR